MPLLTRMDMASSAFIHSWTTFPVWTKSPVWMTNFPLKRYQLSTIQLFIILKSAGFDSDKNCVSVTQKTVKAPSVSSTVGVVPGLVDGGTDGGVSMLSVVEL